MAAHRKNDPFNFFHPDFNCCYRNRTGSARRFAEFTASREFHSALKFYFMRYQYTTMLCVCKAPCEKGTPKRCPCSCQSTLTDQAFVWSFLRFSIHAAPAPRTSRAAAVPAAAFAAVPAPPADTEGFSVTCASALGSCVAGASTSACAAVFSASTAASTSFCVASASA